MEFRKLYVIFDQLLPLIAIVLMALFRFWAKKRDPILAARKALESYNVDKKLHEAQSRQMLWLIFFVLVLACVIGYYRFEVGYLTYPHSNVFFGVAVLIISIAGTAWVGRKIYIETKSKISRISYLINSIVAVIFISLVFGSIQFLIYTGDKDSYVIDSNILAVQIKQDTIDFNSQINTHLNIANEARKLKRVFSDSLSYSVFPFRGGKNGRGFVFTNRADGFEYVIENQNIDIFIVAPWGPPLGPKVLEEVISIDVWSNEIHLQKYFPRNYKLERCITAPKEFDTRSLLEFCDSVVSKEIMIADFMEQKKEIAKVGNVTWDVFGVNAIMSSFFSNPDYNKPVKKLGMIVSILHLIIAVSLIAPNIIPFFTFYKQSND